MALFPLGILSAAGAGGAAFESDYELISTTLISSNTPSVTFDVSTLASTYKHLQIRMALRDSRAVVINNAFLRFNGDTGSNYAFHLLYGNGSSVLSEGDLNQNVALAASYAGASAASNVFGGAVLDILDPFSTTKNKTTRSMSGFGSSTIRLWSGLWRNTAAVTSVSIIAGSDANFVSGSRLSIYGIKG